MRAGREVGTFDVFHQAVEIDVRVVDQRNCCVDHFAEVVRRDVRCHADGDTGRAVDEQVREPARQDDGLDLRAVEVGHEVDGVFVDVAHHLRCDASHTSLGVTHCCRAVTVDRSEVALAVNERGADREVLGEAGQRVVDRLVAVRVVVTHHFTDDRRALAVRTRRPEAELVHREDDAAVDWLQSVARVWERAANDHAHRVIDVRRAHLVF